LAITGRSFPSHYVYIRNAQAPAAQGQAQALAGTIACNLAFAYSSGATPNDSSPLTVAHTLQGVVADLLIFNPQFTPQDTAPLNVTITLTGKIICQLIYTYTSGGQLLDSSNLNVAHTATSNIVTQVNVIGGTVDQITTQSSVACLAVLSAQLAVAHTLQGPITDQLIFTYTSGGQLLDSSNLNVAHTLTGSVNDSLGASGQSGTSVGGSVIIQGSFSGDLNVAHTLQGLVDCYCALQQTGIFDNCIIIGSLNVTHTLQGSIDDSTGLSSALGSSGGGGSIIDSGIIIGSLGVAHTLIGSIDDILVMSGGSNIAITGSGSIITIGTIIENVNVAHTLQGSVTNALVITGDLNVSHTLQGLLDCYCVLQQTGIFDNCIIVGSLNVAHALSGRIDTSTGFVVGLQTTGGGTITNSGTLTGDLGVVHTLQSTINCTNQCIGSDNVAHPLDNTGIVLISTITTSDLGVNHSLISNITIISSGSSIVITGNNGNIALISIVVGSLTNAVALQGQIIDSTILTVPTTNVTQQGFALIPAGCALVGSLNVNHSLIGLVSGVLTLLELISAGAPTVTFPGDFVIANNKFTLLIVPARHTLFGNFKRIIRLYAPKNPGKQRG